MEELTVSKKIKKLPPEAKKQVQDFIDFLYQRYSTEKASIKPINGNIAKSSFFGIWDNRQDMSDSSQWVRNIRKSEWSD